MARVSIEQSAANGLAAYIRTHREFAGFVDPVIASASTAPAVTVAGTPTEDTLLVVQIVATGALNAATKKYSTNGGRDWSTTTTLTSSFVVLGLTLTFAAGTYTAGQTFAVRATAALSDLRVESRWPDPQKQLPPRAITVTRIGARRDVAVYGEDAECLGKGADIDATTALYEWSVRACAQTMQIDIWAVDDFARDDLKARLDVVLNGGSTPTGTANVNPVGGSLLVDLPAEDGWDGARADIIFGDSEDTDSPETTATNEYRATVKGEAWFTLSIQAQSPKLLRVLIAERLRDDDLETQEAANVPRGSAFVDAAGLTITRI